MIKIFLPLLYLFLSSCGPPLEINRPRQNVLQSQSQSEENWFKIIVLDVGQGDATLLIASEGEAALIDAGPKEIGEEVVLKTLEEQNRPTLQNIFISHYHEDHSGGLEKILEALDIKPEKIIDKNSAPVGQTFVLGPAQIKILAVNGQIGETSYLSAEERIDENNSSLALLVQYGDFRYFTDGDLPGGGGDPPYQTIDLETPLATFVGDVDVILVPHHGSHTSSNENFLTALKPEAAILSLGNGNDFFHPHPSVLTRLKNHGAKIYATERGSLRDNDGVEIVNGSICIVTDGKTYQIKPYVLDKCASPPALSN